MAKLVRLLVCCNPFQLPRHCIRTSLRPVQPWMVQLKPDTIHPKSKICVDCRKKLGKLKNAEAKDGARSIPTEANTSTAADDFEKEINLDEEGKDEESGGESSYAREFALKGLNESLQSIGESPVKSWRLKERNYSTNKFQKIDDVVRTKVFNIQEQQDDSSDCTHEKCEILTQLKEKFLVTNK
ncbi:hypothetical protein JTE90_007000 [Oedothorax gibbosus]|uniref:Uncharacterized protein n=1 Tax=Oedothorax gibbosus TaxID=931172 RepID=A0AAV6TW61_9ARAC|nr:hypothetical protein JTE90_007000 [Oedothorax gibbosus]